MLCSMILLFFLGIPLQLSVRILSRVTPILLPGLYLLFLREFSSSYSTNLTLLKVTMMIPTVVFFLVTFLVVHPKKNLRNLKIIFFVNFSWSSLANTFRNKFLNHSSTYYFRSSFDTLLIYLLPEKFFF